MNTEINTLLSQGYICVTSTQRLSYHLQSQYAALQLEKGKQAWETPNILSWNGWLQQLWQDLSGLQPSQQYVLKSHQQHSLWQQIINESDYANRLLRPDATARLAMQAWSVCHQWKLPLFSDAVSLNEDARTFRAWAKEYEQRCKHNQWIDEALLPTRLAEHIKQSGIKLHKNIALLGFDELTPQHQALINALTNAGTSIHEIPLVYRNEHVMALGFSDIRDEIKAAANWCRQILETETRQNIGVIVPNIQAIHHQLENIFDDVLIPAAIVNTPGSVERPYSIAQGQSLTRYAVIDTALAILNLANSDRLFDAVSLLLSSPFSADAQQEHLQRASLDAWLRRFGSQGLTINDVLHRASHDRLEGKRPDQFLSSLHQWQKQFNALPDKQTMHQWARSFNELLKCFRWPGDRKLNSAEYQTVEAWYELVGQFASLDLVAKKTGYREALVKLGQLAAGFSFQPETSEVPVQILGMTGAPGVQFDHLWVMGLHEEAWPGKADPNPFIPYSMQRGAKVPGATAETTLAQAEVLTERLVSSATSVILSYAENDREQPQRPSTLIKPYLRKDRNISIAKIAAYTTQIFQSQQLESFTDDTAPVIKRKEKVSGGSGIFREQAACPFRATARHRLFANALALHDIGPDAMDRGLILHQVMQSIWQQLKTQHDLVTKSDDALDAVINGAVSETLQNFTRQQPGLFTPRFIKLESERLLQLVKHWLVIECKRQPFTVEACEQEHNVSFNNIEIHTRLDRIDKLEDGRYVIIDYKTGDPKLADWFGERPDDPQLPLYAVTSEGDIAAIVFGRIKQGESAFIGLSVDENILPEVTTLRATKYTSDLADWKTLFKEWNDMLNQLAVNFREGDARVDPKNATTCQYCDLHALCRIYEETTESTESTEKK